MAPAQSPDLVMSHDPSQTRAARHPTRPDSPLLPPPSTHHQNIAMDPLRHHVPRQDVTAPHLRHQPEHDPPRPDSPLPHMHALSHPHPLSHPAITPQHPATPHPTFANEPYIQPRPPPDDDLFNVSCCSCCVCACETRLLLKSCDCSVRLVSLICSAYHHSC